MHNIRSLIINNIRVVVYYSSSIIYAYSVLSMHTGTMHNIIFIVLLVIII